MTNKLNTTTRDQESFKRRLSRLIITRSPSSYGEIPLDNIAERDVDDGKHGRRPAERGETGELDQPS